MSNFPSDIIRTTKTLPGTTGGVRADLDVSTGEGAVAGAVAGLGKGITALGIKFDIMEAQTQLSKAKMLTMQERRRLGLSYNTNEDASTYQTEHEKSLETIQSYMPKNARAARVFDEWYQGNLPAWQKSVDVSKIARQRDSFRAVGFLKQQEAIRTGNVIPYLAHLETGKTAIFNAYTDEEAEELGLDTVLRADYNTALNAIHLDPSDDNVEEVLKDHPNLTAIQRAALRREARVIASSNRAETERANKERWDKNEATELWEPWRKGLLTHSRIETLFKKGDISKIDRDRYTSILDTQAELARRQKAAEEEVLGANDREDAERLIIKGLREGTMSEFIISSAATAYGISPTKYEGYLNDLPTEQVSYGEQSEIISLITSVSLSEVNPNEVKNKIDDMLKSSISAGMPKKEADALAIKYREKLALAIKEQDKAKARIEQKGRSLMEELIRDKHPITGIYTADERQILGTAEAIVALEAEIDKALAEDKPLEETDFLIKAIRIGRDIKAKIAREKAVGLPITFFRLLDLLHQNASR